jgi:hypothetical protein
MTEKTYKTKPRAKKVGNVGEGWYALT